MSSQPLLDLDPNEGRRSSVSSGAERRHSYDTLSKPAKYAISETSVGYGSDEEFLGYAVTPNPFLLPGAAEHWREVYEKSEYECRHVFDPDMTWSPVEEKRIIQKLDWHVCLWAVRFLPPFFFLGSRAPIPKQYFERLTRLVVSKSAPCFSPFRSIAGTSRKPYQITCWRIWG